MSHLHLVRSTSISHANDAEPLRRIADLLTHTGHAVRGQYKLLGALDATASTPRLQLTLADATGSVLGFVWPEHRAGIALPPIGSPVELQAVVRQHEGRAQLCVTAIRVLTTEEVDCATDLLVELRATPVYLSLRSLETGLPDPLRRFLQRVLLDQAIGPKLATCRASGRHHHAEVGGLLRHSLECLDLIAAMVRRTLPGDTDSIAIAQLAYFLHDIGKIRTVGTDHRPPMHHVIRHETHNLLLLAEHLAWLRDLRPDLHAGLVYVLEYLSLPASARPRARYFPAEVVVQFDQWSAAGFSRRGLKALLAHAENQGRPGHPALTER